MTKLIQHGTKTFGPCSEKYLNAPKIFPVVHQASAQSVTGSRQAVPRQVKVSGNTIGSGPLVDQHIPLDTRDSGTLIIEHPWPT